MFNSAIVLDLQVAMLRTLDRKVLVSARERAL